MVLASTYWEHYRKKSIKVPQIICFNSVQWLLGVMNHDPQTWTLNNKRKHVVCGLFFWHLPYLRLCLLFLGIFIPFSASWQPPICYNVVDSNINSILNNCVKLIKPMRKHELKMMFVLFKVIFPFVNARSLWLFFIQWSLVSRDTRK